MTDSKRDWFAFFDHWFTIISMVLGSAALVAVYFVIVVAAR